MSGLDKLRGFMDDDSCPQCSRNLDEWNLCHTCGECYEVD